MLITAVVPKLPSHPDFRVVDVLAAADFGWEYLVEDQNGFWVLEEFLPSAETAEDLLTLQAMLTDRLQPFRAIDDDQFAAIGEILVCDDRLFWRREYVPGRSYRQLFDAAIAQDETFSDDAVWDFLEDVLTLLVPLHDRGLVHGAIDLNAVVERERDGVMVLQQSGGMREFGLAHHFYRLSPLLTAGEPTKLRGAAQDLRDLAAAAMVLLTGDESLLPGLALLDELQQEAMIGDELAAISATMLGVKPRQRFGDARSVLAALPLAATDVGSAPHVLMPQMPTSPIKPIMRDPIIIALSIVFIGLVAFALWRVISMMRINPNQPTTETLIGKFSGKAATFAPADVPKPTPTTSSQPEKPGIPADLYDRMIRELATEKMPEQAINRILSHLSEESWREVGTYSRRNYDRWLATLSSRKISQPTVDILSDTAFYLRLPGLRGKTLNPRSFGQLWYAIARDQITQLNQQKNLKVLAAGDFNESGKLSEGQGRVFQVQLKPGDRLKLSLETRKPDIRLSVIENDIVLTRDSINTQWTAPRSSRGTSYEIILTPLKLDAVAYRLSLQR